ncbi:MULTISPECIES: hypothetical protein [unclassified Variovorax]|uniref:hypothetical protein n=1 Tax=unclassified Variovorax TaxID=663243 RepID=UPI00076BC5C1|nr:MULTISPECIES: hypothetical protein [unclassified Variovorax]KWT73959.1 hypothetical protein APY03_5810 [Variovorax sp. WDL1]PNG52295.1 hypothetical protein CHC07_04667 [Variovorax sp. B4]PNG54835.1 hypothetical protein CHC06_03633 [Variovorax sp. B2]VTV15845.1 hypothetical protein WDL1CHR_06207 [Variovorax sp. WDL1]
MLRRHPDFPDLGATARLARQGDESQRACSLVEVARALGVSAPRARQLECKAMEHFSERLALVMAERGLDVTDLLPDDRPGMGLPLRIVRRVR